jgi:uncharacterized membrane protein
MTTLAQRSHVFHAPLPHLSAAFGSGGFGVFAERLARFFGTPWYLIGQTVVVIIWIVINAAGVVDFDVYPFILLNLGFSLQAAYAAPLILLAETRQATRDKVWSDAEAQHRESIAQTTLTLLQQNTDLTQQVADLTEQVRRLTTEIRDRVVRDGGA